MKRGSIAIVTGWEAGLGAGHIQRMANLADYLNRETHLSAHIIGSGISGALPAPAAACLTPEIPQENACIIRDMRDSGIEEMRGLTRQGRVVTVDDCGPGREFADLAIDLLPNLKYFRHRIESFIYGYSFTDSIRRLNGAHIPKTLDIAFYCGFDPSRETLDYLLSLVPEKHTCALLAGNGSRMIAGDSSLPLPRSYAESLLSAKVLISHFGITLYEGHLAGCRLVSVNPTEYHSRLADASKDELGLINLGIRGHIDPDHARSALSDALNSLIVETIDSDDVHEKIRIGLERFYSMVLPFCGG